MYAQRFMKTEEVVYTVQNEIATAGRCCIMGVRDAVQWSFQQIEAMVCCLLRPKENNNTIFAQAVRQVMSGCVSALVDLSFFQIFLWMNLSIFLSAALSGGVAMVANYLITRWYVMAGVTQFKYGVGRQFSCYIFAFFGWLGITEVVLLVLASWMGMWPITAKVCALPIGFIWTFMCNRYLVFKGDDRP